jgi:hypothetical protein
MRTFDATAETDPVSAVVLHSVYC